MGLKVLSLHALCAYSSVMLILGTGANAQGYSTDGVQIGNSQPQDWDTLVNIVNETLHIAKNITKVADMINNYDERCPASEGFFYAPGTGQSQCLKVFTDVKRTWLQAQQLCQNKTLHFARPYSAGELQLYLFERYYPKENFWVNAKGNGLYFQWNGRQVRDPTVALSNGSPLWYPHQPGNNVGVEYCMELLTRPDAMRRNPGRPYWSLQCTSELWTVCEKPLNIETPKMEPGRNI